VDNLGLLMACGLAKEEFTLSRISTLSRQLDAYFSVYLPRFLQTSPDFKNIYTVFAGGDDFFLIGPWNSTIKLAHHLRESFKDYVCQNDDIHFSAGITLHKSHTPIDSMAESAESALEKSKAEDRDRLTLFAETATWEEVIQLAEIKAAFEEWLEQNWINKAMLYRLNELIQMAEQEKRLVNAGHIHVSDLACMRWRALLAYSLERNIGKDIRKDAREKAIREVRNKLAQWILDYGAKLKMPLWEIIYTIRR